MEGIMLLVTFCFAITFGPPVIFFLWGRARRKTDQDDAKTLFIIAAVWLTIGGGICATILS
jgi:hypothetical protein